jgi:hypothetical protein
MESQDTGFPRFPLLLEIPSGFHVPNAPPAAGSVRKWVFRPFLILGQPTEVSTKIILNNN